MSQYLIIFDDQFNANEFMDNININDIVDHFCLDKYKVVIDNKEALYEYEPYTIVPYAVVMEGTSNEELKDLCEAYSGNLIENFSID